MVKWRRALLIIFLSWVYSHTCLYLRGQVYVFVWHQYCTTLVVIKISLSANLKPIIIYFILTICIIHKTESTLQGKITICMFNTFAAAGHWRKRTLYTGERFSHRYPRKPAHCLKCQCGSLTNSRRLELYSSSVQPYRLSVVKLVSDHRAPSWCSATVIGKLLYLAKSLYMLYLCP